MTNTNRAQRLLPRAINVIGALANSVGLARSKLERGDLERRAACTVGLSDFGASNYQSSLDAFCDSLQSDRKLHFLGRLILRDMIEQRLRTRLRVEQVLGDNEIRCRLAQRELDGAEQPIFVVGTPRSGTTLLFNLLALDSQARPPKFWESLDPMPPAHMLPDDELARRLKENQVRIDAYYKVLPPAMHQIHALARAKDPEEDFYLLETSLRSPSFAFLFGNAPTYRDHLMTLPDEEIVQAYFEYARLIRLITLDLENHSRCWWVGKSPIHAPFSWALTKVFPNARILHTRRNPVDRIPSTCSLFATVERLTGPASSAHEIAERVLEFNDYSMKGIARSKRETENSDAIVLDIDYDQLKRKPIATVAQIYDKLGLNYTSQFEESMSEWLSTRNAWDPKRVGAHKYGPDDFGLSRKTLMGMEA